MELKYCQQSAYQLVQKGGGLKVRGVRDLAGLGKVTLCWDPQRRAWPQPPPLGSPTGLERCPVDDSQTGVGAQEVWVCAFYMLTLLACPSSEWACPCCPHCLQG